MGELDMDVSTLVLQAVLQAREDEAGRMGRGFALSHEVWAALKERLETAEKTGSPVAKLHKEMWGAVREHNEDEAMAELQAIRAAAAQSAMEWVRLAATAERALEEA